MSNFLHYLPLYPGCYSNAYYIGLPLYDSPLTMASVMNTFFIDKIDNIRAEFPLLEANLPSYSFLSMDSIMSICPTGLYHFDPVTDTELLKIISCMNKTLVVLIHFPLYY